MSAIVDVVAPTPSGRPLTTYRQAGDRYVLIEYGEMEQDLQLNFLVLALLQRLDRESVAGFVEAAPGFRSILISYDPDKVSRGAVVDDLKAVHEELPAASSMVIPSRLITLPIAFDDGMSREAVQRYRITTRGDAPNVIDGNNIDYLVRCNDLAGRPALYEAILGTQWWNAFTGFFPGLPFLFPLDPRCQISAPKYNPTRMWTAEGTVGMGGPCVVIYPIESPGSYQLFGRTLPIFDLHHRVSVFSDDSILFRPGDRVIFERVDEGRLLELRQQVFEGRYAYRIEPDQFVVLDYLTTVGSAGSTVAGPSSAGHSAVEQAEIP